MAKARAFGLGLLIVSSMLAYSTIWLSPLPAGSSTVRSAATQGDAPSEPCERAAVGSRPAMPIPRILHQNFNDAEHIPPHYQDWMRACRQINSEEAGWQYMFWNKTSADNLVQRADPEFFEQVYSQYPANVMRSDSLRYFLMKEFGGVYIDADVECWREGSDMLEGYDVVLQGDYESAAATNAMMASARGHPLWQVAVDLMKERAAHRDSWDDAIPWEDIVHSTGPEIVRDATLRLLGIDLDHRWLLPDELTHSDGTKIRVYQVGQWYQPCGFAADECMLKLMLDRATGRQNMTNACGMHRNTASWLGFEDGTHPVSGDALLESLGRLQKEKMEKGADAGRADG